VLPASNVLAAIDFLHEELALGAPLPLHRLGHLVQLRVLPAPGEPLVLVAGHAGVPRRHAAPRAEQPSAHLALGLGHAPLGAGGGLDLGADVAGQARAAERVHAGAAAAVDLGGRHGLHADAAWVLGSRHCHSPS